MWDPQRLTTPWVLRPAREIALPIYTKYFYIVLPSILLTGFGSALDIHEKLLEYLEQEFRNIAAPSSLTWNAQLGDIWSTKRRLLLTYNNKEMVERSDILWTAVAHQWGDVQTLDDLYTYLSGVVNK
jgi:hypothetical protein